MVISSTLILGASAFFAGAGSLQEPKESASKKAIKINGLVNV